MRNVFFCLLVVCMGMSFTAEARSYRASDLSQTALMEIFRSSGAEAIVEFKAGDELPLTVAAQGDLIETKAPMAGALRIKKDFWLKVQGESINLSLDGQVYKPIRNILGGTLNVNAGTGDVMNVLLENYLK